MILSNRMSFIVLWLASRFSVIGYRLLEGRQAWPGVAGEKRV